MILVISTQIKAGNTLGAGGGGTFIYGPYRYLLLSRVQFSSSLHVVWNSQWYKPCKFFFRSTKTWNPETEMETEYRIRERKFQALDLKNNILAMITK